MIGDNPASNIKGDHLAGTESILARTGASKEGPNSKWLRGSRVYLQQEGKYNLVNVIVFL